jgi:cytochrome c biogenesis protein CcmG/thiol:disulfide interchange protein DsbE
MTKQPARRPARKRTPSRSRRLRARTRLSAGWLAAGAAAVIVVGVIAAALVVGGGGGSSSGGSSRAAANGEAPTARFATFKGTTVSLADYRGKPLVVNFFASWCTPCLAELPEFEQVHQRLAGRVNFVGLNLQDAVADGRSVIQRTGITYDTGRDPDGELFGGFSGVSMPTTVLVDARGKVVQKFNGEINGAQLEAAIQQQLLS